MKKLGTGLYAILAILMLSLCSCSSNSNSTDKNADTVVDKPWNVTVLIDLSDRIIQGKGEEQMLRDTTLIQSIAKQFSDNVVNRKIVSCKDRLQVMFYPTVGISNASALSDSLLFDLSSELPGKKKFVLMRMPSRIRDNVTKLYHETTANKTWVGSDIYGFFKDAIKISTIKKDYRNILIVLTDGYIYHKESASAKGNEYTYILSSNIEKDIKLMNCGSDLNNLEVLFLEINPKKPVHMDKIKSIIGEWLTGMGCQHYDFIKTDVSANVAPAIKNFLDNE